MRRATWALILVAVAACGRATGTLPLPVAVPTANSLVVTAPDHTDSSHELVASGDGCSYEASSGHLLYQTNAMDVDGGGVVRLTITVTSDASPGAVYSATYPLQQYGRTPLVLTYARTATAGAGNPYNATSGTITIDGADAGRRLFWGRVDAVFEDGASVNGIWRCQVSA